MEKYCNKCNKNHQITDFYICRNKSKLKDGTTKIYEVYRCKIYINNQQKIYIQNNQKERNKRNKIYYENNKKKLQDYRKQNKDKVKIWKQNDWKKNKEKYKLKKEEKYNDLNYVILKIINSLKKSDFKKGYICDIDKEYLINLLNEQDNKCFYCSHKLDIEIGNKKLSQASVDRIDNNLGHCKNNVKWTCIFCNLAKNINSKENYINFIETLRGDKSIYNKIFTPNKNYVCDMRSCVYSDKKNNKNDNILSCDDIRELLKLQNNKCAITGLELINTKEKYFTLKPSLDRIDNCKGHSLDNCRIVCLAVQLGKQNKSYDQVNKYIREIKEIK